jgi:hypothetical protein
MDEGENSPWQRPHLKKSILLRRINGQSIKVLCGGIVTLPPLLLCAGQVVAVQMAVRIDVSVLLQGKCTSGTRTTFYKSGFRRFNLAADPSLNNTLQRGFNDT